MKNNWKEILTSRHGKFVSCLLSDGMYAFILSVIWYIALYFCTKQ